MIAEAAELEELEVSGHALSRRHRSTLTTDHCLRCPPELGGGELASTAQAVPVRAYDGCRLAVHYIGTNMSNGNTIQTTWCTPGCALA